MAFKVFTVAECGYESDCMVATQDNYLWESSTGTTHQEIRFTITSESGIKISSYRDEKLWSVIEFKDIDLDSLILFLQDAAQFVQEEKLVNILKTGRPR